MLIRKDSFVESWYTPGRTGMALSNYADLVAVDDQFGAVEIVADVRRAVELLPPRLATLAARYWFGDYSQVELAHLERCGQPRICALLQEAREKVIEFLGRGVI